MSTPPDLTLVYAADIVKMSEHDDGTVTIYGKAAGPDLDLDGQRLQATWLKQAMGDWYARWGNIRESHDGHRAVGKAVEYEPKDDDHFITARIIDPLTVAKVKAGVLSGLSVGIKSPRIIKSAEAPNGLIAGGTIVEVSAVDCPSNQTCKMVMKAAGPLGELMPIVDDEAAETVDDVLDETVKGALSTADVRSAMGLNADLSKLAEAGLAKSGDEAAAEVVEDAPGDDDAEKKPGLFDQLRHGLRRAADVDVTKDASGHSHIHGHADGNHTHAHTHESLNYDHGDGEPHAHEHDGAEPNVHDEGADAEHQNEQVAATTGSHDTGSEDTGDDAQGADDQDDSDGEPDEDDRGTPVAYEGEGTEDGEDDAKKKPKAKTVEPDAAKDVSPEERDQAVADGKALHDGSYLIRDVGELRSAVTLAKSGHGDATAARKLIKRRASELGREDLVPDAWKAADAFRRIMDLDAAGLVDELSARFGEKAADADMTKAGEIEGIAAARRALASLIMDEAAELLAGDEDETKGIDCLLDALRAVRLFELMEGTEGELAPVAGDDSAALAAVPEVEMATAADLVKMLTADDADSATARDDIIKALGIDVDGLTAAVVDQIKSDIEATKSVAEEGIQALVERLAKVEEMATPGGPSRARRPADAAKSAEADRLRAERDNYRHLANEALDGKLRQGYSKLASDASVELARIEA